MTRTGTGDHGGPADVVLGSGPNSCAQGHLSETECLLSVMQSDTSPPMFTLSVAVCLLDPNISISTHVLLLSAAFQPRTPSTSSMSYLNPKQIRKPFNKRFLEKFIYHVIK